MARVEFVHSACGEDADLRREVLDLLERSDPAAEFFDRLESLVDPLRSRAGEAMRRERDAESPPPDLPLGTPIGRYRIVERIGAGGMGTVYRAVDPRLQRDVALKFLPPALATDPRAGKRFLDEARAAAALDHPNICTVHEIGETDDGHPFLAMALYHGETLRARLDRDGLSIAEATAIAAAVARGLKAAHAHGIVHRDVKPGNVMLTDAGEVKLLDFGLATAADAAHSGPHFIYGTVAYMAPEQLRGEALGPATDLWALGVMLYEMLGGRRPFEGGEDRDLVDAILHADPPALAALRPDLPARLVAVVERLLRKDPAERYDDARPLLADLKRVHAAAVPAAVRRRRLAMRIALVATLAGFAAIGVRGDRRVEVPTLNDSLVAVLPFDVVGGDSSLTTLARRLPTLIDARLEGMPGARPVNPGSLSAVLPSEVSIGRRRATAQEAFAAARNFGAGRVVLGSLTRFADTLTLTASLYDVGSGHEDIRATAVGTPDSVPALANRVAGRLAIFQSGEGNRIESLNTASLSALRLVLEGMNDYHAGRYDEAHECFIRALRIDTGYAFADLMAWKSNGYHMNPSPVTYIDAWRHRARLAPQDREFVDSLVGPSGPDSYASVQDILLRLQRIVQWEPNNPAAWSQLASWIMAGEGPTARPDSDVFRDQANTYAHVLTLNPGSVWPMRRIWEDAMYLDDTALADRYAGQLLEVAEGQTSATMRCILGSLARGRDGGSDPPMGGILARMDSGKVDISGGCLGTLYNLGAARYLREASAPRRIIAEHIMGRVTANRALLDNAGDGLAATERDLGRPSDAVRVEDAALRAGLIDTLRYLATRVRDGLWWDGDTLAANRAAAGLERRLAGFRPTSPTDRRIDALCVLGEWRLAHGESNRVARMARDLGRVGGDGRLTREVRAYACGRLLDVWRAAIEGTKDVHHSLALLAARDAERPGGGWLVKEEDIILSRLLEGEDDIRGALTVLERDRFALEIYTTPIWRREGRLAALLGDTATAIEMYHRFLSFRTDPEPSRQASVTQVQDALTNLTR